MALHISFSVLRADNGSRGTAIAVITVNFEDVAQWDHNGGDSIIRNTCMLHVPLGVFSVTSVAIILESCLLSIAVPVLEEVCSAMMSPIVWFNL